MTNTRRAENTATSRTRALNGRGAAAHGRAHGPHAGARDGAAGRDRLHRLGFHAADHAPAERLDAWRAFSDGYYDVDAPGRAGDRRSVRPKPLDAGIRVEYWWVGPLLAGTSVYPAFRFRALERSRQQMGVVCGRGRWAVFLLGGVFWLRGRVVRSRAARRRGRRVGGA